MNEIFILTKEPLACLLILLYSSVLFHSKQRLHTYTYRVFNFLVAFSALHLVSAAVTEYTVNHREQFSPFLNDLWHVLFGASLLTFLVLLLHYMIAHLEKALRRPVPIPKIFALTLYVASLVCEIVLPAEYVNSRFGSYMAGPRAYVLMGFAACTLILMAVMAIVHHKTMFRRQNVALLLPGLILTGALTIQVLFPYILLTPLGVTMTALGLMLSIEDAHRFYNHHSTLHNEEGCRELIKELLVLRKPFEIGVYAFVGPDDDIHTAATAIQSKFRAQKSRVICGMLDDDTMLVIPTHGIRRPTDLPEEFPRPDPSDTRVQATSTVMIFSGEHSLSAVLHRILEFRDVYEESVLQRDELTGTLRRPSFIHQVEHMLSVRQEMTFLMLDLDNFKAINDTYGHQGGDLVLQKTAEGLRSLLRASDLICRMGGDEFGVALPGLTDTRRICEIAAELKHCLTGLDTSGGARISVSFSIGARVNAGERCCTSFREIYADADRALYSAKASGRNRVSFGEDEMSLTIE